MASELPNSSSTASTTAFYEFEELDIIEFDEDTIRELLEDTEEEVQDNYSMAESKEVQINQNIKAENSKSIEKIEAPGENYNWIDAMETTADMPCDDLALWYKDTCSDEMVLETTYMRETMSGSQLCNAFQMDEVAYTGLWQDK